MPATSPLLQQRLEFPFPTPEVHAGIPLANGTFGALLGSDGKTLRITLNRADYWDHRGSLELGEEATYANLRHWLETGDEARLRTVFEGRGRERPGVPAGPTRLPLGRVDLELPPDWSIAGGGLHLLTGEAELELAGYREQGKLRAAALRETPVLCLRITGVEGGGVRVHSRPPDAPETTGWFRAHGYPRPQLFDLGEFGGWVQDRPGEPAVCVGWLRHDSGSGLVLYVTSVYGENIQEARKTALQTLEAVRTEGYTPATLRSFAWQRQWWSDGAAVRLPDATLELLYYVGMYRLGGVSVPGGPAATLQGAWVEEHRLPPGGGGHRFNIHLQECCWPCVAGNRLEALEPLIRLLKTWEPRLRENARRFVGVEDGLLLPQATDDRGAAAGGYWPGAVDPSSTAWAGHLLWLCYRHTLDREFLRGWVYPFLKGAMRVYEALLEDDGREWSLPVSVSPEYGGAEFHAWGRNASFQLAVIHFLCRALCEAAETLSVDASDRARWADIDARLPAGAVSVGELLLWEGQPLAESHPHHSHLAGIYPFATLDPHAERDRELIQRSVRRWTQVGHGSWAGWSVPWAAILHARLGNGERAALLLEEFRRVFMGPGGFSTHDARVPGWTVLDQRPDGMQVGAGLGAAAAVLELLLHTSGGLLRVFPAIPACWQDAEFRGVRAEGAFLVSAVLKEGRIGPVEVVSEAGAPLRLANPWGDGPVAIKREGQPPLYSRGRVIELHTSPGEKLRIEAR